ncbi:hypothetical protein [Lysinibacillus fusiformis]|uniref:hypothetical protein n=2 Tax=Lysinibacillus fusiformis TaxID=28031 RepID=UPI0037162FC0
MGMVKENIKELIMGFYFEYVNIDCENVQDYLEKMPFAIKELPQFLIDISGLYLPECNENWFPSWIKKINGFPLYFFIEVEDYMKKEFNSFCVQYGFDPKNYDLEGKYKIIEVVNEDKLKQLFSLVIPISCAGDLVLWVTQKNIFFEKNNLNSKQIRMLDGQNIFFIGHDCENLLILSNDSNFKNAKAMSNTFPDGTKYEDNNG